MTPRKPLRTQEEIDAAYPAHALLHQLKSEEQGAQRMLAYLWKRYLYDWSEIIQTVVDYFTSSADDAEEAMVARLWNIRRQIELWEPNHGDTRQPVLEAIGIDWDAFWKEKEDMLEQLGLAQEEVAELPQEAS